MSTTSIVDERDESRLNRKMKNENIREERKWFEFSPKCWTHILEIVSFDMWDSGFCTKELNNVLQIDEKYRTGVGYFCVYILKI